MKVLFLQDVPGTADAGEVKVVKNGYARNYLLPKKLATPATADQLQRIKAIKQAAEEQRRKEAIGMQAVADRLQGGTIVIEARVGPTGRLYGAITSRRIAEEASRLADHPLDHRGVILPQAIHEPGTYPVTVRLHREVTAEVSLVIVPEGQRPPEISAAAPVEGEAVAEAETPTQAAEEEEAARPEGIAADESQEQGEPGDTTPPEEPLRTEEEEKPE